MTKCKKCRKKMNTLDLFSGNLCVDCYEKKFDEDLKKTGILPRPDFRNIF